MSSKAKNQELYPRVVAGDKAARDEMIVSNQGLVVTLVDKFLRRAPGYEFLREDLVSEGFGMLVEAVDSMASSEPVENPDPASMISRLVRLRMSEIAGTLESAIRIPTKTRRALVNNGKRNDIPRKTLSITYENEDEFWTDSRQLENFRETIEDCCESEEERIVVAMRDRGAVDDEIAAALDVSRRTVGNMRQAIYTRFLERTGIKE